MKKFTAMFNVEFGTQIQVEADSIEELSEGIEELTPYLPPLVILQERAKNGGVQSINLGEVTLVRAAPRKIVKKSKPRKK